MGYVGVPQDVYVALLGAPVSPAARVLGFAVLFAQYQFGGDEGAPKSIPTEDFVALGIGRSMVFEGLAELRKQGILRRTPRPGRGRPATYAIVSDIADWVRPAGLNSDREDDTAQDFESGIADSPCPAGRTQSDVLSPRPELLARAFQPLHPSTASSKKGGPSSALPPSTPSASGPTSDVVPAVANERKLEIEDVWTPPPWPQPMRSGKRRPASSIWWRGSPGGRQRRSGRRWSASAGVARDGGRPSPTGRRPTDPGSSPDRRTVRARRYPVMRA